MIKAPTIFLILGLILLHMWGGFSLTSDGLSLLSLKSAIDGGDTALADWNENDATPCHWTGISCMNVSSGDDPRVVGIAVSGRNLRGYIPSELGTLIYLRRLNLHGNNFYGSIPDQLFNATSLHSVFLYGCARNKDVQIPYHCHYHEDLWYSILVHPLIVTSVCSRERNLCSLLHSKLS